MSLLLPIIDLSIVQDDSAACSSELVKLGAAAEDTGFFCVIGIEKMLPSELCDRAFEQSRFLFNLPKSSLEKIRLDRTKDKSNRGFEGLESQSLDLNAPRGRGDLNFSYRCTEERDPRRDIHIPNPPPPWSGFFNKPNKWPDDRDLPDFRLTMLSYLRHSGDLAARIFTGLEKALGMEPRFLLDKHIERLYTLRLLYYPAMVGEMKPGQVGCGTHKDFGTITLVRRRGKGCLQIKDRSGEWIEVRAPEGSIIVNIGEQLNWWTNKRLKSTLHRVEAGQNDFSLVTFCYADPWKVLNDGKTAGALQDELISQSYRHAITA